MPKAKKPIKKRPVTNKKKVASKPAKKVNKLAKGLQQQKPVRTDPVWEGPHSEGPQGGITQSLLSLFMVCRERFRLRVMEGLAPPEQFNHRIEYGSMWHLCEETPKSNQWMENLHGYCSKLCRRYPLNQQQIVHWYNVCKVQFPVYQKFWAKNADEKRRKPFKQEQTFNMPYTLPSGRVVRLRGKWDGLSQYGKHYYLDEHKTKGEIHPEQTRRQMNFDLQTMLYLTALKAYSKELGIDPRKVVGVRYNIVLRPLSGGKHSIRQYKPTKTNPSGESEEDFYARLAGLIAEEPGHYFHRWVVDITDTDIDRYCKQFLDPILEQLCDWWEYITTTDYPFGPRVLGNRIHWRTPYGFYNVLGEGGTTDVDEYLATGSEVGLVRGNKLFRELGEE